MAKRSTRNRSQVCIYRQMRNCCGEVTGRSISTEAQSVRVFRAGDIVLLTEHDGRSASVTCASAPITRRHNANASWNRTCIMENLVEKTHLQWKRPDHQLGNQTRFIKVPWCESFVVQDSRSRFHIRLIRAQWPIGINHERQRRTVTEPECLQIVQCLAAGWTP